MAEIILDPSIRDWVVLPMIIIFGCSALVRHYITLLLRSEKLGEVDEMRKMQTFRRAQMARVNSKFINANAFAMRKHYFTASQKKTGFQGVLREKVRSAAMSQMMNPNSMLEMMKGNMTFMVSNFVMMGLMSYFFGGFVLVKVPFSLTQKFKMMLQRGIELNTLDVSYVSSVSWYFLVMFGMRGFLSLVLGEQTAGDEAKAMQMQMGMGAGPGMAFDAPKVYKQERVSLRLHNHEYALEHAEKKFLGEAIPVKESSASAASTTTTTTGSSSSSSSTYAATSSDRKSKHHKFNRRK